VGVRHRIEIPLRAKVCPRRFRSRLAASRKLVYTCSSRGDTPFSKRGRIEYKFRNLTMNTKLKGTEPILCASIIRQVDQHLIGLLTSLDSDEWDLPTVVPQWSVRDVAAHLLDTALRKLSTGRDTCRFERVDVRSHQDLITLVNRLNREGVTVYRRLSPPVLTQIMQLTCAQTADFYESLDPFARATIGVSWAGETTFPRLVRHCPRTHRALAPSGADPPRYKSDEHYDAASLPSGSGHLSARSSACLQKCYCRNLYSASCRNVGRFVANGAFSDRTIAGATLASSHPTSPLTSSSRSPLRDAFSPRA
jgi:hypothetical protein